MLKFWITTVAILAFVTGLDPFIATSFNEEFFANFLSTRLGNHQITVFISQNGIHQILLNHKLTVSWAVETFARRNRDQIAVNILKSIPTTKEQVFEDIFLLDGTRQAFLFFPESIAEAEYYLRMTLNYAYRAPRMDDRLNKVILFFLFQRKPHSLEEFAGVLETLTRNNIIGMNKTQYMYPTVMDSFYIINGTDLFTNVFEVYSLGRRNNSAFFVMHPVPFEKIGLFTIRRNNFYGVILALATIKKHSIVKDVLTRQNPQTNQTELIGGLAYNVITSLQLMLNFSTQITIYEKGWNENIVNFSYQDIGRVLYFEEEDIVIGKSSFIDKRALDFKLMVPHHIQGLYAFFIQPSTGSGWDNYWNLFSPVLWSAFGMLLILICWSKSAMTKIIEKLGQKSHKNQSLGTVIADEILFMVALITQQGWTDTPVGDPARLLSFSASVLILICMTALTAKLTSTLSIASIPIRTFLELIRTNIRIAVDKDSTIARDTVMGDAGQFRFDEVNTRILKRNHDRYCDMFEGAKLVMKGSHTFLGYGDVKTILVSQFNRTGEDFCSFSGVSALPVHNLPFRSGMIATQNFPYKEFFNTKLTLLLQTGLMNRYTKHFEMDYSNVDCDNMEDKSRLMDSWQELLFLYEILLTGYVLSLLILLIEKCYRRMERPLILVYS